MVTTPDISQLTARAEATTRRRQLYWTLGNLLLFGGIYLLLYVGGVYATVEYQRLAARGDSDIAAPREMMGAAASRPQPPAAATAAVGEASAGLPDFAVPVLNTNGQIASAPPAAALATHQATVERIVLPSIKVDSKVIEVGWHTIEQEGQEVAVWEVAEFAVGQHKGSANPGEGGNIVLAGHVGGFGQVFRDLYYVRPGEPVILYSEGRQYVYVIEERLVLLEEGAPPEQRAANAQLIAPTGTEVVTMVTCWPGTGPDKFKQRVVIRAVPFGAAPPPAGDVAPQTAR